jgi:hypothetical protein
MKLKSFKRYLTEEQDKNALNSFIENAFAGEWNKTKTDFGNFIGNYSCQDGGMLSRIIFFPKTEMEQLTRLSDLKTKLKALLTTENQGHPRFYTKDDFNNIPDHLSFLAGIGQKIHGYTDNDAETSYMGIIFQKKSNTNDNVDFKNYDGHLGNNQVKERIELTKPVLSVNSDQIKIVAAMEFEDRRGWVINPVDSALENDIGAGAEEETPVPQTNPEEEDTANENK